MKSNAASLIFHSQYEAGQRKREEKTRQKLKEKEHKFGGPLRKETWIHPSGGRRIHRTTPLDLGTGHTGDTSDEEELDAMSTADVGHIQFTLFWVLLEESTAGGVAGGGQSWLTLFDVLVAPSVGLTHLSLSSWFFSRTLS